MTGIVIFLGYLLVGAIIGRKDYKMHEEVLGEHMEKFPSNLRGALVAGYAILVVLLAPIISLIDMVMKLKPKR